jgi:hypothetical protein
MKKRDFKKELDDIWTRYQSLTPAQRNSTFPHLIGGLEPHFSSGISRSDIISVLDRAINYSKKQQL